MIRIAPMAAGQADAIVGLALAAWAPVFASLRQALPTPVYRAFYPHGWEERHRADMLAVITAPDGRTFVAEVEREVVGFAAIRFHTGDGMGEVHVIGVSPEHQGKGVGLALMEFCLATMRAAGMSIAMVETAGDIGHAPARALYERAGFELWPIARYFRQL